MKCLSRMVTILLMAIPLVLSGCGNGDDSGDGMQAREISPLTENQVSNLILMLPVIMDFAEAYQSRLTPQELDSPDANDRYFKALKESTKISNAVLARQFRNVDEMMAVYKNVLLEYTLIKKDLTNRAMIEEIGRTIEHKRAEYNTALSNRDLTKSEADKIQDLLDALETDRVRYENILLVKKFERELDKISSQQGQ